MKKMITLLAVAALVISVASCGAPSDDPIESGTQGVTDTDAPPAVSDTAADTTADTDEPVASQADTYTCKLDNGITIVIGGDADALINELGEAQNMMEAPSCVHPGFDRIYTYEGFSITTSPDADGKQYVAELTLDTDAVAIGTTVMIGCDAAELDAVFGDKFEEQFGVRKYALPGVNVSVIIDGDTVSGITLSSVK